MHRRRYLAACAGATGGLAGCSGILGDDDAGPAETAREFYRAAARGDREAANDLVHPDSPAGPLDRPAVDRFAAGDLRVESAAVAASEDDVAEVRTELRFESYRTGERDVREVQPVLRRGDGAWLLWDRLRPSPLLPTVPRVVWHVDEETGAAGVGSLWITHGGGDDVETSRLSVRAGDRSAAPDGDATLAAGSTLVVPLDADGEALPAGTAVDLAWTPSEADEAAVIARHALAEASAGALGETVEVE